MKRWLFVLLAVWSLSLNGRALAVEEYAIDPAHSKIGFSIRNLLIGRVHGGFRHFSGKIVYDEGEISRSSVEAVIETWSIHTGNTLRDRHLRTVDFFNVAEYPKITFRSSRVDKKDDGYLCTGEFSMHGVSREMEIPFQIVGKTEDSAGKKRIKIKANFSLDRNDYGISWNRLMESGGLTVGNAVRVLLDIELVEQS